MEFQRIGFLGCGNMGSALARAAAKRTNSLLLANRTPAKAETLAAELGGQAADNGQVARDCDLIFLGVKPQMMAGLLAELAPVFRQRTDRFVLVTMAAGLSMESIRSMAGGAYPVIRIMPNTPASIGEGMILYCSTGVEPEELEAFCTLMAGAGALDELPQGLIDAGSALSGCGPAFCLPSSLRPWRTERWPAGCPGHKAQQYAAQTLIGAAKLVLESGAHPGALKDGGVLPRWLHHPGGAGPGGRGGSGPPRWRRSSPPIEKTSPWDLRHRTCLKEEFLI